MYSEKMYYFASLPISFAIFFVYYIYFIKFWGATPGKRIAGLMVIKKTGYFVGWKEAIMRHIVELSLTVVMTIMTAAALRGVSNEEFIKIGANGEISVWPLPNVVYIVGQVQNQV
jgi:uncharacterized RDD family membrane protein YckC